MSLASGTRIGAYDVTSLLGAGGMGEVYRARDSRLQRDVAVKILPAAFAADPDRLRRFAQEARAAAALNHPNILSVFDVLTHDGSPCLVSELLEGEPLRDVLAGGALPPRKAIEIATQIASGLAAAHDKGIVHRDLKPDNVFVTGDGRVKILDFGLAKLTEVEPAPVGGTSLPTVAPATGLPQTTPGMVMGTIGYMAPEQVRGAATDARTDIFALGVVLYEMLAGRRAFSGETTADVMSAILRAHPPDIGSTAAVPPALLRIIDRCLEKQPTARFQSARDLAFALESLSTHGGSTTMASPSAVLPRRRWMATAAIGVVAAALAAAAAWVMRAPTAGAVQRLSIVTPSEHPVVTGWTPGRSLAISPDGRTVVFVGLSPTAGVPNRTLLFVRRVGEREVHELPGTEGAAQPFFSPDGRWVGFFGAATIGGTDYALRKVQLSGGTPITIVSPINGGQWSTGAWLSDGTIVFSSDAGPLMRVPANGGTPQPMLTLAANESSQSSPVVLPGERELLFAALAQGKTAASIWALTLATGARRLLLDHANAPLYIPDNHLAFTRDEAVLLAPFDADRMAVGDPVPLGEAIQNDSNPVLVNPEYAIAADGTLAYLAISGDDRRAIVLASGEGTRRHVGEPGLYRSPTLSPDGTRVALGVVRGSKSEIAVLDLARGTSTRLAGPDSMGAPAWRPNGLELAVSMTRGDGQGIWLRSVDSGAERLLVKPVAAGTYQRNMGWSPDGKQLAFTRQSGDEHTMWVVDADGGEPRPLAPGPGERYSPRFAPDGRWLAYISNESGRGEVYIQSLGSDARVRVSVSGGMSPVWAPDGKSLYFFGTSGSDDGLLRVPITMGADSVRAGTAELVVKARVPNEQGGFDVFRSGSNVSINYAVLPDGGVLVLQGQEQDSREIVLVQNFKAEAARLTSGK